MKNPLKTTASDNWKNYSPKTKKALKLLAVFIILACGPMPLDFGEFYSFFYPENATSPENTQKYIYTPLFLNEDAYENQPATNFDDSVNIEAWKKYLDDKISFAEIKKGLYEKQAMESLIAKVKSYGDTEAAEYLKFCSEIDKSIPLKENYWDETLPADTAALKNLYSTSKTRFSSVKSDFVKERYAFQAVRLAAVTAKPEQAINDYETLIVPIKNKTFISGWARSRKAGVMMNAGDVPQAICEFAQVFETCPSKRYQADLSVRRLEKPKFEEALGFCKNDKEKAAVYALWAIQPFQDGMSLVKKIYAIDPQHPMLELVTAREINKNEYGFFASKNAESFNNYGEFNDDNYNVDPKKVKAAEDKSSDYFKEIFDFVNTVIKDKKAKSNQFWLASAAYLSYLNHENDQAKKYIEEVKKEKVSNPYLIRQMAFLEIELADKTMNAENEAFLIQKIEGLKDVQSFRDNIVLVNASKKLSDFYAGKGEKVKKKGGWLKSCTSSDKQDKAPGNEVKAFLAANIGALPPGEYGYQFSESKIKFIDTCSAAFLRKVIAFLPKTENDKKLVALADLKTDDLNLALVRRLTTDGAYQQAAEVVTKVPEETLLNAQFGEYFKESPTQINGKKPVGDDVLAFLKNMALYKKQTEQNPGNAEAWYQLGVGQYNLSYHGNAWLLIKREKSSYELEYGEVHKEDYYTTEKARSYFEKALAANPDAELGAKICYAGALCERNQYLIKYYEGRPDSYDEKEIDDYYKKMVASELPGFRTFFEKLKTTYRETQYQKMVLKECETYSAYLK
jgi:hypothetical protein